MSNENAQALDRALLTLREVTKRLSQGVNKTEFENEFRGKYVSPGVSVRRHVEELRISGSLEETKEDMKLKRKAPVPA